LNLSPQLAVAVAADGFGPESTPIPVQVLSKTEFDAYSERRRTAILDKQLAPGIREPILSRKRVKTYFRSLLFLKH